LYRGPHFTKEGAVHPPIDSATRRIKMGPTNRVYTNIKEM